MSSAPNLAQAELDTLLGFAPDDDSPIDYMRRTRDWYLALGYGNPYRWAHYQDVPPFHALAKPLSQCTATIITTASTSPIMPASGDPSPVLWICSSLSGSIGEF